MDIQYIMAVAPGASNNNISSLFVISGAYIPIFDPLGSPTTFWSIKANSTIEIDDILSWCLEMANTQNRK